MCCLTCLWRHDQSNFDVDAVKSKGGRTIVACDADLLESRAKTLLAPFQRDFSLYTKFAHVQAVDTRPPPFSRAGPGDEASMGL